MQATVPHIAIPGSGGSEHDASAPLVDNASAEQRLGECVAELRALQQQYDVFAFGISHELRAPLRAIDGFAAQLQAHSGTLQDAGAQDYLERIRVAAARLARLIDALLDLSRASRAEYKHDRVDLSLLADWVAADLQDAEPGRAADIDVQPGIHAMGDERQLKLLLAQLMHNAWKFSRDRDRVRIELRGAEQGGRLQFSIRDYGSGFDPRYADKLFQPFQRLHGAEEAGGDGIGLAIAQRIVQRHGGRIHAQSELGAGSIFFVELPAAANTP